MSQKIVIFLALIYFTNSLSITESFVPFNDNPCENITLGYVPYEPDCSYFIQCYNYRPTIIRCPIGQIFDRNQMRCMYGDPDTCEGFDTTTPQTTTTVAPFDCPLIDDPVNPVFFPHPEICSRYFMCWNGTAIERECHYGLYWSIEHEWCDFAENVNCDRISTTSIPPPTPQLPFCSDWVLCPREGFGYLPNFNHCFRYFECILGVRHLKTCRPGTIFDVIRLRCDYPENALCVVDAECVD